MANELLDSLSMAKLMLCTDNELKIIIHKTTVNAFSVFRFRV